MINKTFFTFQKKKKKSREPDSDVAFIRKTIWCGFLPNKSFKQGKMTILSSNSNYKGDPMKGNFIFSPYGLARQRWLFLYKCIDVQHILYFIRTYRYLYLDII